MWSKRVAIWFRSSESLPLIFAFPPYQVRLKAKSCSHGVPFALSSHLCFVSRTPGCSWSDQVWAPVKVTWSGSCDLHPDTGLRPPSKEGLRSVGEFLLSLCPGLCQAFLRSAFSQPLLGCYLYLQLMPFWEIYSLLCDSPHLGGLYSPPSLYQVLYMQQMDQTVPEFKKYTLWAVGRQLFWPWPTVKTQRWSIIRKQKFYKLTWVTLSILFSSGLIYFISFKNQVIDSTIRLWVAINTANYKQAIWKRSEEFPKVSIIEQEACPRTWKAGMSCRSPLLPGRCPLGLHFSDSKVTMTCPGTYLKCRLWFRRLGWGLRVCVSNTLPGAAGAAGPAGPRTALWKARG